MAIDPVCPQVVFPVRVTLFPSVMLYVTNIVSKYRNNTPLCSELNEEHADESYLSLWLKVFGIGVCEFEKDLS